MRKQLNIVLIILSFSFMGKAQDTWTNIQNIDSLITQDERPVILFFSADWCKFCSHMNSSFTELSDSTEFFTENYYLIKVDEKEKGTIHLYGEQYAYVPRGIDVGEHELATTFAKNKGSLVYPTTVILWRGKILFSANSIMSTERIYRVLKVVDKLLTD